MRRKAGDFARVHAFARSAADVPDDQDARLVVLPAEHVYTKDGISPAEVAAKTLLESRGNSPRLFRNSLVFLAADKAQDAGPRRCRAPIPGVEIDRRRSRRARSRQTPARAGGNAVEGRRVHGAREDSRDLSVDARSRPGESAGARDVSGDASFRERCPCRPRQQEAEERRTSRDLSGADDPQEASRRRAALARGARVGSAADRLLRDLHLSAAAWPARTCCSALSRAGLRC